MLGDKLGRPLFTDFSSFGRAFDCSSLEINFGYQRVAGSIPASRKFIFNMYLKYLLK
jgi:hypothetical protein